MIRQAVWPAGSAQGRGDTVQHVEIQVEGQIDPQWSEWLSNLAITHRGPDTSLLKGEVIDQAALYGLLTKLRDLRLALVSVAVETRAVECVDDQREKGTDL
jgi:hypothetical protein